MTDTEFQQTMLEEMKAMKAWFHSLEWRFDGLEWRFDGFEWRFDGLEWKVDTLSSELREFRANQEDYNNTMWKLSNQAFHDISDIRAETIPAWKSSKR